MNHPYVEPPLTTVPEIPKEFGEDGGHFYRYYDAIADELDEDMIKSLKTQLDGILIFAGLFAGVNTAFLAFTLPGMSPDPNDDIKALLLQIATKENSTIQSAQDLPSASFSPSVGMLPVNILLAISLAFAIISAFLAVLGQQWLVYYRKKSGGGVEYERWEQLRRYLGAKRWRMELVLDDLLPGLLQAGLIIFCVAFTIYLGTLSKALYYSVLCPMVVALGILILIALAAVWDKWCPFKSPLSHFVQGTLKLAGRIPVHRYVIKAVASPCAYILGVSFVVECTIWNIGNFCASKVRRTWTPYYLFPRGSVFDAGEAMLAMLWKARSPEGRDDLQIWAAKRVLLTSEEPNALVYASINLQAAKSVHSARIFFQDSYARQYLEYNQGRSPVIDSIQALELARACTHLLWVASSSDLITKFISADVWDVYSQFQTLNHVVKLKEYPSPNAERYEELSLILILLSASFRPSVWRRDMDYLRDWVRLVTVQYSNPEDCPLALAGLVAKVIMMIRFRPITNYLHPNPGNRIGDPPILWARRVVGEILATHISELQLSTHDLDSPMNSIFGLIGKGLWCTIDQNVRFETETEEGLGFWLLQILRNIAQSNPQDTKWATLIELSLRMLMSLDLNETKSRDMRLPCTKALAEAFHGLVNCDYFQKEPKYVIWALNKVQFPWGDFANYLSSAVDPVTSDEKDTHSAILACVEVLDKIDEDYWNVDQSRELFQIREVSEEYESNCPALREAIQKIKAIAHRLGIAAMRVKEEPAINPADDPTSVLYEEAAVADIAVAERDFPVGLSSQHLVGESASPSQAEGETEALEIGSVDSQSSGPLVILVRVERGEVEEGTELTDEDPNEDSSI